MSVTTTTTTTYRCDSCGYETTTPDEDKAIHATVHIEISITRRRKMTSTDGEAWPSAYVRRVDPVEAWVCGNCVNTVLAVINSRVEAAP